MRGCRVLCGDGNAFILVDAGERNRHDGPDIEDVVIIHGGGIVKGDVELPMRKAVLKSPDSS